MATEMSNRADNVCIDALHALAVATMARTRGGLPGLPGGAVAAAYVLWTRFLRHNPADRSWPGRDRFVVSVGHGSALLYSLLHLTGYALPPGDRGNLNRGTAGRPGGDHQDFIASCGDAVWDPVGQGFAAGVGMAIAAERLAIRFNRPGFDLVPARVFALVTDGDLMEGIAAEAASLAGHLRLGRLIYLYGTSVASPDQPTGLSYSDDWAALFRAYGWHVQVVADGAGVAGLALALEGAIADPRPSLVAVNTPAGFGSRGRHCTSEARGTGERVDERLPTAVTDPPADPSDLIVPPEVLVRFREAVARGRTMQAVWEATVRRYAHAHPAAASDFRASLSGEVPAGWHGALPSFGSGDALATRAAFARLLGPAAPLLPQLLGGSADCASHDATTIVGSPPFSRARRDGRNLHYGVREHAMGAMMNGIAVFGGSRPFGGTFLPFSDYMRGSVRLAAMKQLPVVYIWSHDSLAVGGDGATHQPVEHLSSLRAIPGLYVLRPADANETAAAFAAALRRTEGPSALILARQDLPVLTTAEQASAGVSRGAYVLLDAPSGPPDIILIGTGSELQLALEAGRRLRAEGRAVRVVSMPCMELFNAQSASYRQSVLPLACRRRLAIEAGASQCWWYFVGLDGDVVSIERFGASAPADELLRRFGFSPEAVLDRARALCLAGSGGPDTTCC